MDPAAVDPAPAPVAPAATPAPTATPAATALGGDPQRASRVEPADPIGQWTVAILVLLLAVAVGVVIRIQLRIDRRPEG